MKTTSMHIQFYLLVPMIFSGFTALAAMLTYHLMRQSRVVVDGQMWPLFTAGGVLVVTAFVCGWIIIWFLLRPIESFVRLARQYVPDHVPFGAHAGNERTSVLPITNTLHRVTEVLGNVEARALFPNLIAPSPAMRSVLGLILKVAPTDSTVLILGENGTGKELVARTIHAHSRRADKPFVVIHCAGMAEPLLESEMFGHEKGAVAGAHTRRVGKLESANGGTVFLDEIAELPLNIQVKILRLLQEKEIDRVGGDHPIPSDIRLIAATNKDLVSKVKQGTFREDVFARIDVFALRLPALRERTEDIPLLATHLLREIKPGARLSPLALAALTAHHWPGNVRELKNTIEAAAVLADDVIQPEHLTAGARSHFNIIPSNLPASMEPCRNMDERMDALEKGLIMDALIRAGGVQVRAAELLGIKERSLWHRIAKHRIDVGAIRAECTTSPAVLSETKHAV
jgi:transcriptional regulator with GAF, ATPase, and Fis domain